MDSELVKINKFSNRTMSYDNANIKKRIEFLTELKYDILGFKNEEFDNLSSIFTLILTVHDTKDEYIEESLHSVLNQNYLNTEVIIIDHGTTGILKNKLFDTFVTNNNKKIKLIRIKDNIYNPSSCDFKNQIVNLWNAGVFCSKGDYVYFLACDDKLSLNYVKKMVSLFEGNELCCTASPLVKSINENGLLNIQISDSLKNNNIRPKYTDGIILANNFVEGGGMISFPGGLLAIKSNLVLECGGFDNQSDLSQIFKFAINGDSGFDPDATMYWRHHSEQTNKNQTRLGLVYYKSIKDFYKNYGINELHNRVAGKEFADNFDRYWNAHASNTAINCFRASYKSYGIPSGLRAIINISKECTYKEISMSIFYVIIDSPAMFYINYAPQSIKNFYKYIKNFLISRP